MKGYKTLLVNHEKYNALVSKLSGCGWCTYEEADGDIVDHCQACRLAITTMTIDLLNDSRARISHEENLRRMAAGEEPILSPSVDPSEAIGKIDSVQTREDGTIVVKFDLDASEFIKKLRRAATALEREFRR
jgi:hypothetical protein